jgi:SAM-dependent methyltransferase
VRASFTSDVAGRAAGDPVAPDVETASDAYAHRFAGPVGEWLLAVQTAALRELLAPFAAATVLDVGGGHAQAAVPLVADGHRVTVTGSEESCRGRLDRLLPAGDFAFERCPLDALPFPDRSFEVVVALRLLAHAPRWDALLAELCRVARAAVVFDYPPRSGMHRLAGALYRWKVAVERDTRPYRRFPRGEVAASLARFGWEPAAQRRELLLPLALHRLVRRPAVSRPVEGTARRLGLTRRWGAPVLLRAAPLRPRAA